jgi:cell division protein FtsL
LNVRLIIIVVTLAAVVCSALGVVYSRHESRRQAVQLGALEDQRDEYIAEWSRLQIEQAVLAGTSLVESKARERLGMDSPDQSVILMVESQ